METRTTTEEDQKVETYIITDLTGKITIETDLKAVGHPAEREAKIKDLEEEKNLIEETKIMEARTRYFLVENHIEETS